jgi:hypothetical protein
MLMDGQNLFPGALRPRRDIVSESEGGVSAGGPLSNMYTGPADRSNLSAITRAQHYHDPNAAGSMSAVTPKGSGVNGMMGHQQHLGNHSTSSYHGGGNHVFQHQTTQDVLVTEGSLIEDAALHEHYNRVLTPGMPHSEETRDVCHRIKGALDERARWVFKPRVSPQDMRVPEAHSMTECLSGNAQGSATRDPFRWDNMSSLPYRFRMVDGVVNIWNPDDPEERLFSPPATRMIFLPPCID